MEQKPVDRVLRALAVLFVAVAAILAFATPAGQLSGAAADRPATQDYIENNAGVAEPSATAANAEAGGYDFLLTSEDHPYPARWCSGTDLGYTIDFSQAIAVGLDPQEELQRWREIFDDWTAASKEAYTFTYIGESELGTKSVEGAMEIDIEAIESDTIGITYVYGDIDDAGGSRGYLASAVEGRTAGNGGLQVVSRGSEDETSLVGDRGFVMIDASDALSLAPDGLRRTLYTHEAGHALGLGHVTEPKSLMHGTLSESRLDLARGDLTGVNELATMPCSK